MEDTTNISSEEQTSRLQQPAVVPSASILRPDSAGEARDALLDGKTIEVPNSQTMKLLRLWSEATAGKFTLSVSVDAVDRGWTVLRRL